MAGIGFVLRKLTKREDLTGISLAYFHAIFASTGPWIITIATIWAFFFVGNTWGLRGEIEVFRVVIFYNFSASLVLTAAAVMVSTRYLADCIYRHDVTEGAGILIGTMGMQLLVTTPLAFLAYAFFFELPPRLALLATLNFTLISGIWVAMVYVTTIKYFSVITGSFFFGMGGGLAAAYLLSGLIGPDGLLLGFNVGLAVILTSFVAITLVEYPPQLSGIDAVLRNFKKYRLVALAGVLYNMGIWVDKWLMWSAPEARVILGRLVSYPEYDSSMFLAYLIVIPAMAYFMLVEETSFFEEYIRYYKGIFQHDSLEKIEVNRENIMQNIYQNGRNILVFQGALCFFGVLLAPKILEVMNMSLKQVAIFRFGLIGATFQTLALFLTILLTYFDERRWVCLINGFFLLSNCLLTLITLKLGFTYYGLGFCLSGIFTFLLAAVLLERYVTRLSYHTFVTRNKFL